MPIAAAVPASVTPHDSGPHPLPATGAYEIRRYNPSRGAILIRNPHFQEWSRDAQPAGYPNQIVFRVYPTVDQAIAAVEHGSADLLFGIQSSSMGGWSPSLSAMRQLATQYATQIHPAIVSGTEVLGIPQWLANDRRGRLAISYALDRREISTLLGGPLLAQPTCQLLPPNFPGYRPYCPYTINAGEHAWSAPDLTRAEQLAKHSRNYGRTIIVQSRSPLSAYLVQLLDKLGYKARLQTKKDHQPDIGFGDFLEDYPGAADFIQLYAPPFLQHRVDLLLASSCKAPTPARSPGQHSTGNSPTTPHRSSSPPTALQVSSPNASATSLPPPGLETGRPSTNSGSSSRSRELECRPVSNVGNPLAVAHLGAVAGG